MTGGTVANTDYEKQWAVASVSTGHAESSEVYYDRTKYRDEHFS